MTAKLTFSDSDNRYRVKYISMFVANPKISVDQNNQNNSNDHQNWYVNWMLFSIGQHNMVHHAFDIAGTNHVFHVYGVARNNS